MANATGALLVKHEAPPKELILKAVGNRADVLHPLWSQVLVAVYNRAGYDGKEAVTTGGIILVKKATDEDKWQGKVGLVLALGPYAFRDANGDLLPNAPKVGDWVHYRVGDTLGSLSGELMLRFLDHENIRAVVDDPDLLY